MGRIIGLKFRDQGQVYFFTAAPFVVEHGEEVLVKTEQGLGLARVVAVREEPPRGMDPEELKPIFRIATEEDKVQAEENSALARASRTFCQARISERDLDMKLVDVEVFFDRSKVVFYFTASGRIDFRELVKDLVREYKTRIELRQIGVRHETQMLGGVGNCGKEYCCRQFLRTFDPVTIRMAKEQNLFLNPAKISGGCGRLLCCLGYEQQNYTDFHKRSPRTGRSYTTGVGRVRVLRTNLFRDSATIQLESGEEREVTLEEWQQLLRQEITDVEHLTPVARPQEEAEDPFPSSGPVAGETAGRKPKKTTGDPAGKGQAAPEEAADEEADGGESGEKSAAGDDEENRTRKSGNRRRRRKPKQAKKKPE